MMFSKITLALVVLIFITDCQARRQRYRRPNNRQNNDRRLNRKARLISQAVNDFGISLYKELAPDNTNLVLAPVSVLTTMSMVMLGASGDTERNLFQGLKLQPLRRAKKVHRAFKQFTRSLSGPLQNVTLDTGNAMYVREETRVSRRFKRKIRKYYDGESKNFDFSNPEGPEAPINEWIETKTRGMIRDFLSVGDIDDDTVMWLLNAVYFKGTWELIFEETMTNRQSFRVSSSQEVQVDMMHNDYSYASKYNSDLQVKVLEMPYAGDRFSFFIILPENVGLTTLESQLNYQTLEGLITNLDSPTRYEISIPKFKLESTLDLVPSLQGMGVATVFQRNMADLSGINGQRNLFVDKVKQKAVLEVNERGTLAAAVTGVRIGLVSLPPQFRADHPFIYVLRDKSTATNLFIGRVVNPADAN